MKTGTVTVVAIVLLVFGSPLSASGHAAEGALQHKAGPPHDVPAQAVVLPEPIDGADFPEFDPQQVELGRLLFFDKILSGNRNTSCATCHHGLADTGDGLSLPIGEGGRGLGVTRDTGEGPDAVHERVPRNAPPVFNLGADYFTRMFHDGRVEADPTQPSGFLSPAGDDLPMGLDSALAAQAMFPVTSGTEMAGQLDENEVADAAAAGQLAGTGGVWDLLAQRLRDIPEYVALFEAAFDDVLTVADITFVHAANAIAAFEGSAWRADDSPFDRYLRGDHQAMSVSAQKGMRLFYGRAGCGSCHSGAFQTDLEFHAVAMPQIGPGKGDGTGGHEDFGRERVTLDPADRYRFRTPPLRNVAITGPWGHAGAYDSLEAVVRHQLDPVAGLESYDMGQAMLPPRNDLNALDFVTHQNAAVRGAIGDSCELAPKQLADREIEDLVEFLHALTDPKSLDIRRDVPMRVPSGLTLAE